MVQPPSVTVASMLRCACRSSDAPAAREAHTEYLRAARFPSLDGLRCLSILPVVWHHSTLRPLEGVLGRGPIGVDFFFAISGFLITTLLLREADANGQTSLTRFYMRRALRIFPLYYAVLAMTALHAWLLDAHAPERAHFFASVPYYASYTSNWFVAFDVPHAVIFAFAWSLATEEQFYLVWPWLLRIARAPFVGCALALLLLAIDQSVERGFWDEALPPSGLAHRMLASIASPICLGSALACALHDARSFRIAHAALGARWSAPLAFAVLAALVVIDGAPLLLTQIALTSFIGACAIRPDHGMRAWTDARPVRWIGTVSYGIYMMHVPAIGAVKALLPAESRTAPLLFACATPMTIAVASVSYLVFEAPISRLRSRFRASAAGAKVPSALPTTC